MEFVQQLCDTWHSCLAYESISIKIAMVPHCDLVGSHWTRLQHLAQHLEENPQPPQMSLLSTMPPQLSSMFDKIHVVVVVATMINVARDCAKCLSFCFEQQGSPQGSSLSLSLPQSQNVHGLRIRVSLVVLLSLISSPLSNPLTKSIVVVDLCFFKG